MLLGGLIIGLLREHAMRLFTDDPIVIGHGRDYLLSATFTLAAYPILFVTVFAMQGIKKPAYGLWMGLYRQLLAPAVIFQTLAFTLAWGTWGVWWGICIVNWSGALFALYWGWKKIGLSPRA
jgi:Na+-driven multidrug efflux pump